MIKKEKRKVSFHSLGCKVNSYETEAMRQKLEEKGYEIVDFGPGADIYIINTCTVTNIADRKSRQMLHKAKKMNPHAVVIAVGCYVQAAGEELLKDEAIDIVVGTNRKSEIDQIIEDYFRDEVMPENKHSYLTDVSGKCGYDDMEMTTLAEHTRAFIKIQDGCNQFCTYCIIPYARGRIRSRKLQDIRKEVEKLAENGYKEVVLTGIHLSSYGKDQEEDITLLDAIREVSAVEKIERVRLGSLEQGIITDEFVQELAVNSKFCPHFHLSLQSGCDTVLKRMNRHYTSEQYLEKCRLIRKYFEKPALTTDVIVGFPGETEEEFLETEQFLEKAAFAQMHIFKYSMRKGTVAARMENQVGDAVKTERSEKLLALNEKLESAYRMQFLDSEEDVLMEEKIDIDGQSYFVGHTREYIKAAVETEEDLTNKIIKVKFKKMINKEILLAELVKIY
ncbi:MAG: tRNA (N(6)-L-threonylcarbamoyladenosine(37)-C(2))-methylthiotransferase MtaB [Lachnospiraceae bacterium]|nr:tRNA (N(6)-L-threonylcarbamoyladenosine(37)-C(2))-methylthiotransferase MtaB [Lachnospiraceae bacterium]